MLSSKINTLILVISVICMTELNVPVNGEEQNVTFKYKESVTLDCNGLGENVHVYNSTSINGTMQHVKLESSKKVTVNGAEATIVDLRSEEIRGGSYSCRTGPNEADEKRKFVVKVAPYFYKPEKLSITITEGGKVEMNCVLLYGAENSVTFTWSKDENSSIDVANLASKYQIVNNANSSQLTILDVVDADKGKYNCLASNDIGSHTETIQLRVKDQLAALWPFLAIVAEVIILCLIILIYEKRCNKKPSTSEEDTDVQQNLMGKDSSDVKKRTVKA